MSEEARSLIHDDWGYSSHRKIRVEKVENGFKTTGVFQIREECDGEKKRYPRDREFVFYTVEEVLDFVRQYLEAKSLDR